MSTRPVILSIAGYDSSSGAGITADIKTAAAMDCYAVTCMTALTVQSTQGVFAVEPVEPDTIRETLSRLADDFEFAAVRIGMLGTGENAEAVADFLRQRMPKNVVFDPVLRSSSGTDLIDYWGIEVIRTQLLPLCNVITPNLEEALALVGDSTGEEEAKYSWEGVLPDIREAARRLHKLGSKSLVITGGDLWEANDYLSMSVDGGCTEYILTAPRIESRATHGTGCAFASAIACCLANGLQLVDAVRDAKEFVRQAMTAAYPVGKGKGPLNHLYRLEKLGK